jgi:transglutaminase-like putative cysteine protease
MRRWWQLREGWLTPFLLLAMVMTAVGSLQSARWHPALRGALGLLTYAALVGWALGFLLAWIRRIPRGLAHLVGAAGGLAWVIQLSGALRAVSVPGTGETLRFLDPALQSWKDVAVDLLIRALVLWRTFIRGAAGEDVVLFVVILAVVAWLMGFLSTWFAIRSHWVVLAVGFPGGVLLLNTFYAPKVPVTYFGFYVFLALIFLVYYFWKQRETDWQEHKVRYPQEMGRGVFWAGVLLSAILVLGTAFLPTTAGGSEEGGFWEQFIQPWREVRSTWERLFSNVGGDFEPQIRLGEYSPSFGLGGARSSPDGIAFEVRSTRNEYLRGIAFDQYDGRGWASTAELGPLWVVGKNRLPVSRDGRVTVEQEIIPRLQGGNMVFAYAEPVSVSLPAVIELSADIYGASGLPDVVAVRTRTSLIEGLPYRVVSYVSAIDKTSLRQSGQSYPAAIAGRYLQLPSALPQRVYDLADRIVAGKLNVTIPVTLTGDLTLPAARVGTPPVVIHVEAGQVVSATPPGGLVRAGLVTPYDASEAIEEYLRTQYRYSENISAPPTSVDVVDYFLFESKVGYCDYFASAMTVLMRTQGIPARLIRGYAAGYYNQDTGSYLVPARVAHSWTEVYFPVYGWQRFEPTAADYTSRPRRAEAPPPQGTRAPRTPQADDQMDDARPPRDLEDDGSLPDLGPGFGQSQRFPWAAVWIPGMVLGLGVLGVGGLALRANRGLGRFSLTAATYERMCRWADIVNLIAPGEQTPYEISGHLADTLPERRTEVSQIASAYVRERFSLNPLQEAEVGGVSQSWKQLRWTLWSYPGLQLWNRVRQLWGEVWQRLRERLRSRSEV